MRPEKRTQLLRPRCKITVKNMNTRNPDIQDNLGLPLEKSASIWRVFCARWQSISTWTRTKLGKIWSTYLAKYVDQILPNFVLVHVDIDCHLAQKTRQIEADFSNGNPRLSWMSGFLVFIFLTVILHRGLRSWVLFSGRIYFFHILFWVLFFIFLWTFISLLFPFFICTFIQTW